jgi:hypothetical protein
VGPRAGLDAVVKKKIPSPRRDSNPYPVAIPALVPLVRKVFNRLRWAGHVTRVGYTKNVSVVRWTKVNVELSLCFN